MRAVKRFFSQLHRYLFWLLLMAFFWAWIFFMLTDTVKAKKVTVYIDAPEVRSAELEAALSGSLPEGIKLIKVSKSGPQADPVMMRNAALALQKELRNTALVAAYEADGKPQLLLMYSDDLVAAGRNAGKDIREAARFIQGGGGGQPGLATAGGKDVAGLKDALEALVKIATGK